MKTIQIRVDCLYDGKHMASMDDNPHLQQFLQWLEHIDVGSRLAFYYNNTDDNNTAQITFVNENNDSLIVPEVSINELVSMLFENSNKKADSWEYVLQKIEPSLHTSLKDVLGDYECRKLARICVERYLKLGPSLIDAALWSVCSIEWGSFQVTGETEDIMGDEFHRADLSICIGLQPQYALGYSYFQSSVARRYQPLLFHELHLNQLYRKHEIPLWENDAIPLHALVEYKGKVNYDNSNDELWMLEQKMIRDQEIQYPKNGLCRPDEEVPRIKPEDIYMELPPDYGLGDYMELLGLYEICKSSEGKEVQSEERTVYICNQAISRFAFMLLRHRDFRRKYLKTLQAVAELRSIDVLDVLKEKITHITVLHELGHHVFRKLANTTLCCR